MMADNLGKPTGFENIFLYNSVSVHYVFKWLSVCSVLFTGCLGDRVMML